LLYTKKETSAESLDAINQFLTDREFKLSEGFQVAYLSLLKSIKDNQLSDIGSFCERGLYREIHEGLVEINREA
jgi:hypothetical protein